MKIIATSKNFTIVNYTGNSFFVVNRHKDCVFSGTLKKALNYANKSERCLTQGTPSVMEMCK